MWRVEELAKALGLSQRALRVRLYALRPVMDRYTRRGPQNQLIITDGGRALLERLEQLRKENGLSVEDAARLVKAEVGEEKASGDALSLLVEELRTEIQRLREENTWLRERLEEYVRLALPKPREGLFSRLRRLLFP